MAALGEKGRSQSKDEQDQLDRSNKKAKPTEREPLVSDETMSEIAGEPNELVIVPMEDVPVEQVPTGLDAQMRTGLDTQNQWSYKDRLMGINGGVKNNYEMEDEKYWDEEDFSDDDIDNEGGA